MKSKIRQILILTFMVPMIAGASGKEVLEPFGFNQDWQIVHQGFNEIEDYYIDDYKASVYGDIAMDESSNFGVSVWSNVERYAADSVNIENTALQVAITDDCGDTWEVKNPDVDYKGFVVSTLDVYSDGQDKRTVYLTLDHIDKESFLFMKSTDNCKSWQSTYLDSTDYPREPFFSTGELSRHFSRLNRDTMFWTFSSQILRSFDGGQSWENGWPELLDSASGYATRMTMIGSKDKSIGTVMYALGSVYTHYILTAKDPGGPWHATEFSHKNGIRPFYEGLNSYISENEWYLVDGRGVSNHVRTHLIKTENRGVDFDTLGSWDYYRDPEEEDKRIKDLVYIYEDGKVLLLNRSNRLCLLSDDYGETFSRIIDSNSIEKDMGPTGYGLSTAYTKCGNVLAMIGRYNVIMKYSPQASVSNDIKTFTSRLFPNPVSSDSKVFVSIENNKNRTAKCTIVDIKGQAMTRSQEIQIPGGKHTIDFSTLSYPSGTYFLLIESAGEVIAREKFIVK